MFMLTKITDLVSIPAKDLGKPSAEAIEDDLNRRYANRIIPKVGLCICFYDLLDCTEGLIGQGTGTVNVNVIFRMIVFRPFKGEVLAGKISSSTEHGIKIRLDFFDEIFVPQHLLFENCHFSASEAIWIWNSDGQSLYFDKGEDVRFRVESEFFHDQAPVSSSERAKQGATERKSPYAIEGSMSQSGLGPCIWW